MPPKKQQQKMSLFEFNANGDWADDMDETPLDGGYEQQSYGGYSSNNNSSSYGASQSSYAPKREYTETPVPDVAPWLAKVINLPYDITEESVQQFFGPGFDIKEINLVMDRDTGKPRGMVNMEFGDKASLERALTLTGQSFGGRPARVFVSTPRDTRTERDWTRRGPLPPIEGESRADTRDWSRRPAPPVSDFDGPRETREAREAREDAENPRDFSNWSRRGPLPSNDNEQRKTRGMEFRERRTRQDDPENPRDFGNWERRGPPKGDAVLPEQRERAPRPARKERSPTRADQVDSWRGDAKPSGPGKTVNLSGGSLFGAAKPIDTTERLAAIEARKEKERQELLARKKEDAKPKVVKEDKTERTWERRGPLPPKGRDSKPAGAKKDESKPKPKATFAALAVEGEDEDESSSAPATETKPDEAKENVDLPAAVEKLEIEDDGDWNVVSGKKRR
ncbi:hypothetical protein CJU90_6375 [Yarrowia sp. C11]|nr:hypothetical protein CJU90_6375 [Yarrowia sp. C11]